MTKLLYSPTSGAALDHPPQRRLGWLLRIPALAGLLLATGCSFIPAYQRPEAPIATTWPSGVNEPTDVAPVAELPWQQFFTDPRLSSLIEIALFHNRDLRVAIESVEQARALYGIRRADQFPTLNAGGTVSRAPAVTAGKKTNVTTYNVGLLVNAWEIDFFGRIESLKEAALAQYLASEQGARAAQISLVSAVANTWFALLADQQLIEITRQTLETRQQSQKLAQLRFDNGVTSELDLRQAESLTEAANASLASV
ncbi:MAG: TolC family protein, partial [Burkholderiales bacterium]